MTADRFQAIAGHPQTLTELSRETLGKDHKPKALVFNDKIIPVSDWTELTVKVIEWLSQSDRLTAANLPLLNHTKTKYFINATPEQKDHKGARWKKAGRFFVDVKYNADDHVKNIMHTLAELHCANVEIRISFC